jgi:hypothetical protein
MSHGNFANPVAKVDFAYCESFPVTSEIIMQYLKLTFFYVGF